MAWAQNLFFHPATKRQPIRLIWSMDPVEAPAHLANFVRLLARDRHTQTVTVHPMSDAELRVATQALERERARYTAAPADAKLILQVGESPRSREIDPVEHAAWTQVAGLFLNLSEFVTRK